MKIDRNRPPDSIACPSCGAEIEDDGSGEDGEIEVEPDSEVIRSGGDPPGDAAGGVEPDPGEEGGDPVPDQSKPPIGRGLPDPLIPKPRRQEYKMPELISNIGEKPRTPAKTETGAPKLDASRMVSIDDERLAPPPEAEEGAVKTHVARKITGWDLDGEGDEEPDTASASYRLKGRLTLAAISLVSLLFVGLIIYGVAQSLKEKEEPAKEAEEKAPELIAREALSELERDALDKAKETFAAAGVVIGKFLNAPTYKERLEFVRDRKRVEPLMKEFYSRNPDGPIQFREPEEGWRMSPYESFLITTVITQDFKRIATAVELQKDGKFLVDWESFVGYSEIPWDQMQEKKPTKPFLVRVRASIGDYYNYGFTDDAWACVQLQDKTHEHTIYGYVDLEDEVLDDLKSMMTLRGATHLTLKLVHAGEGKGKNQFLIKEAVAKGWVFSELNFVPDGKKASGEAEDE